MAKPKVSKSKAKQLAKQDAAADIKLAEKAEMLSLDSIADSNRVASGVLASHPDSKDIKIEYVILTLL
jgi:hypothetical protein